MIAIKAVAIIIVCLMGLVIGFVWGVWAVNKRYPDGGYIVIDLDRNSPDTIKVHAPEDISHWHQKYGVKFKIEVLPPIPEVNRE